MLVILSLVTREKPYGQQKKNRNEIVNPKLFLESDEAKLKGELFKVGHNSIYGIEELVKEATARFAVIGK